MSQEGVLNQLRQEFGSNAKESTQQVGKEGIKATCLTKTENQEGASVYWLPGRRQDLGGSDALERGRGGDPTAPDEAVLSTFQAVS